jgi:hypothetical protein
MNCVKLYSEKYFDTFSYPQTYVLYKVKAAYRRAYQVSTRISLHTPIISVKVRVMIHRFE